MNNNSAYHIRVKGIVQGVGFRPFVYNHALTNNLMGWVKNTSSCVEIWIEGDRYKLSAFIEIIKSNPPPLSVIEDIQIIEKKFSGFNRFEIINSVSEPNEFQQISPDLAICPDCWKELFDKDNRRYLYPFINCTNCGPRFSIIKDIPYDRINTTMFEFQMCPSCRAEYEDPTNRRFHAQPTACAKCGPKIWLNIPDNILASQFQIGSDNHADTIRTTRELLRNGKIIAVKGLGGFHLMCDATRIEPIALLRKRKKRSEKPLAVMMPDIETVDKYCRLSSEEITALEAPSHPIVILEVKDKNIPFQSISPSQTTIGVMLPYTPLHALLLKKETGFPEIFIMTSGNLSDEPICIDNNEALNKLEQIADAFLLHNREIQNRSDDSLERVIRHQTIPIRRSRGYVPIPVKLSKNSQSILACGAELKNTFCLSRQNYAFLSHHIGDLDNYENLNSFENGINQFEILFRIKPEIIAYDLHPDYLSTRYALNRSEQEGIRSIGIQHHHAHIASLMTEKGIPIGQNVIGIAFDGTGFGTDGTIWGGEILNCSYSDSLRLAHLDNFPLPGGEAAIKNPSRIAFSLLHSLHIDPEDPIFKKLVPSVKEKNMLYNQITKKINSPLTSSMGRLFDAVSALCEVRKTVSYEGQAAIELETYQDPDETGFYEFGISNNLITWDHVILSILKDLASFTSKNIISTKFHNGISLMVSNICSQIRADTGMNLIALSGGVWQNVTLLRKTIKLLEENNFAVICHNKIPTNDGGISLGQAAIAAVQQ